MSLKSIALLQGIYYVAGGLWPLAHMRSFEAVTGEKTDRWLVRTMSGLLVAWGAVLIASARRGEPSRDLACAAASSAAVLAGADALYVSRGRIARTYLLDAAAEAALTAAWSQQLLREPIRNDLALPSPS